MERPQPDGGSPNITPNSGTSSLLTRRRFLVAGILGGIGLGLELERRINGQSMLSAVAAAAMSPRSPEVQPQAALDSFIDTSAETFAGQCSTIAHIRAGANPRQFPIANNRLIGVFVGFPDQRGGIADLEAGLYHEAFLSNAGPLVRDLYHYFMGINFTVENRPGYILASHEYAYYTAGGFDLFTELVSRGLLSYAYDGQAYPIVNMFDAIDQSTPNRFGGGGGCWYDFGYAIAPGRMLRQYSYNFKYVITHEVGHALSLVHNPNPRSVMNPGNYDGLPKLLDRTDIQDVCTAIATPTPTQAVPTVAPSVTPTVAPTIKKTYIPLSPSNLVR